jgi:hypothetical protein
MGVLIIIYEAIAYVGGVEGLVARMVEQEGEMVEWEDVQDCFEEVTSTGKDSVAGYGSSRKDLVRMGISYN